MNQIPLPINQNPGLISPGLQPQGPAIEANPEEQRRHRRSKHDPEGRIHKCDCGKSFLSKPALNNHIKTKHPETLNGQMKRGRGRPRKYPPKEASDFESTKYPSFFNAPNRKAEENKNIKDEIPQLVQKVFDDLYNGNYKDKLFSSPKSVEEEPILNNIKNDAPLSNKPKNEKTCDEVFYEYLKTFKDIVNDKYFLLLTKFVILFRECYDCSKNKDKDPAQRQKYTGDNNAEGLPDLCNEFYGEFLEQNNFFDIEDQNDRNEIIEIIQHFCIWLFKNEYTKSKLSLASSG